MLLFFQSHTPKPFWSYVIKYVGHLINRLPSKILNYDCPYNFLYSKIPNYTYIRIFCSLAYACSELFSRTKLNSRSRKSIFLAFQTGVKGCILYDIVHKNVFICRDVVHFEHSSPFATSNHQIFSSPQPIYHHTIDDPTDYNTPCTILGSLTSIPSPPNVYIPFIETIVHTPPILLPSSNPPKIPSLHPITSNNLPTTATDLTQSPLPNAITSTRQFSRISKPHSYLKDYHCSLISGTPIFKFLP